MSNQLSGRTLLPPLPFPLHAAHTAHEMPHPHHADVFVLQDVAVEHGHAGVIHHGHQHGDAAPFGYQYRVLPGGHEVIPGIGGVRAFDGENQRRIDMLVEGVVHAALVGHRPDFISAHG